MERIPGRDAQIEWNDDDQLRLEEVVVFNRRTATERQMTRNERRFLASHGACVIDWMTGERARSTPEGQFVAWLIDGFKDEWVMLEALDQLGQIEEAAWARTMARALREILRQRLGEFEEEDGPEPLREPVYEGQE